MHINHFPSEILGEIFVRFVCPSKEHLSTSPSISSRRSPASPYVIAKICKLWRAIALKLPLLWTCLHVVDPLTTSIVQHLEEWINRAGTLPLCLSLRAYRFESRPTSIAVARLFLNSLHRCQSFEMIVQITLADLDLENVKRVSSTSLESVTCNVRCSNIILAELFTNILLDTRSLRTIRWTCGLCPLDAVSPSWVNLRELSITTQTFVDFVTALSHCKNLERLEIHVPYTDSFQSASITLPKLTYLSVLSGGWPGGIVTHLILPALVELKVVTTFQLLEWVPLLDLIRRSGAILRRLSINLPGHMFSPPINNDINLPRILKLPYFQSLRILEVEEPMEGQDIIDFLTLPCAGEENEGYLVHLERISLVFGGICVTPALRKMINSRLGTLHSPKRVREYIEVKAHTHFSLAIPPK